MIVNLRASGHRQRPLNRRELRQVVAATEVPEHSAARAAPAATSDARAITFSDIPSRDHLEVAILSHLRAGITNSEIMRAHIVARLNVVLEPTTANWNQTPSGKFVNEHAWALKSLVQRGVIYPVKRKEYRLK